MQLYIIDRGETFRSDKYNQSYIYGKLRIFIGIDILVEKKYTEKKSENINPSGLHGCITVMRIFN